MHVKISRMTSDCVMEAMDCMPFIPHRGQIVMSASQTLVISFAQSKYLPVLFLWLHVLASTPLWAWARPTTSGRRRAFGAKIPKWRTRLTRVKRVGSLIDQGDQALNEFRTGEPQMGRASPRALELEQDVAVLRQRQPLVGEGEEGGDMNDPYT
jgi:hypothetical protein